MSNIIVIYHGLCADGFTAAWAARKKFGEAAVYYPAKHDDPPPDVTGLNVVMLDFCYKPAIMEAMSLQARSIYVLDHHKSAAESLPHNPGTRPADPLVWRLDNPMDGVVNLAPSFEHIQNNVALDSIELQDRRCMIYAYFDMNRSGAGLAWDAFHPKKTRPALVNHVEDRDLWLYRIAGTREVQAAVFSYDYTFENWDRIAAELENNWKAVYAEGTGIIRKLDKDLAELLPQIVRPMEIGGVTVPAANLPYTMASEAGALLSRGVPFAATYYDTPEHRVFGLRSEEGGRDVSEIALLYGGGGHARAAGFRVPRWAALAQS